jgi:hypothetical protein
MDYFDLHANWNSYRVTIPALQTYSEGLQARFHQNRESWQLCSYKHTQFALICHCVVMWRVNILWIKMDCVSEWKHSSKLLLSQKNSSRDWILELLDYLDYLELLFKLGKERWLGEGKGQREAVIMFLSLLSR